MAEQRLIDANAILYCEAVDGDTFEGTGKLYARKEDIDALPTIEERKTGRTIYQAGYAEGYKKGKQDYSRGCTGCKWEDMNGIGCSQCARRYIDQFEPMEVERP